MIARADGSWYARAPDGTWLDGTLTPADLDAFERQLDAVGFFTLAPVYGTRSGDEETLALNWARRASVTARGPSTAFPALLGQATAVFLGLRPSAVQPWAPSAVRLVWRARSGRVSPREPLLAGGARPRGKRGERILIGEAASAAWTAVGRRSYAGPARAGRGGYLVAVEPAL
jgi:hypothetical protein